METHPIVLGCPHSGMRVTSAAIHCPRKPRHTGHGCSVGSPESRTRSVVVMVLIFFNFWYESLNLGIAQTGRGIKGWWGSVSSGVAFISSARWPWSVGIKDRPMLDTWKHWGLQDTCLSLWYQVSAELCYWGCLCLEKRGKFSSRLSFSDAVTIRILVGLEQTH